MPHVEFIFANLALDEFGGFFHERVDVRLPLELAVLENGVEKPAADVFGAHLHDFGLAEHQRKFALGLAAELGELALGCDDFLYLNLREFESLYEPVFGALLGGAFNHHHFALVAYVDEVEGGVEHLLVRGVDDEFAV